MNKKNRWSTDGQAKYIKSVVYGGIDGTITTFAVVTGGLGAEVSVGILLVLGTANLFGDGISMACGDFISSRAEREYQQAERKRELEVFAKDQSVGIGALRKLLLNKGFDDVDSTELSKLIAKNKHFLVDLLLADRNITWVKEDNIVVQSLYTFFSFVIFGAIPLMGYIVVPYVPSVKLYQFSLACGFTAITLFSLGAMKVHFTQKNWIYSGFEMLFLGGLSASAAYVVGYWLSYLAKS